MSYRRGAEITPESLRNNDGETLRANQPQFNSGSFVTKVTPVSARGALKTNRFSIGQQSGPVICGGESRPWLPNENAPTRAGRFHWWRDRIETPSWRCPRIPPFRMHKAGHVDRLPSSRPSVSAARESTPHSARARSAAYRVNSAKATNRFAKAQRAVSLFQSPYKLVGLHTASAGGSIVSENTGSRSWD